jgi:colicin import membrane protein
MEQNEIIKVIKESAIESQTGQFLQQNFQPFYEQVAVWQEKALAIKVTDISQTREMKLAREIRLAIADVRIAADKRRKTLKEDSIRYGKAIQGVYNVIEHETKKLERYLEEQERFAIIQEQNRITGLRALRTSEIFDYTEFIPYGVDLGNMTEEQYQLLFVTVKKQKEYKLQLEQEAEQERINKEKAEKLRLQKLQIENAALKREQERKNKQLEIERLHRESLESEITAKEKEEQRINKEKREQEEVRLRKEARAGDKEKLLNYVNKLTDVELPDIKEQSAIEILEKFQNQFEWAVELIVKYCNE